MLTTQDLLGTYNITNPLLHNNLEIQYPSYISNNHLGLCLRARISLLAKTIVGSALMIPTTNNYSHDNPDTQYKHVSIMGCKDNKPIYGRVIGKYAFCNHSCDPNCMITPSFLIKTIRPVQAHEELTVPYNAHIAQIPWKNEWTFACACHSIKCKKIIDQYRTDIVHPATLCTISSNK